MTAKGKGMTAEVRMTVTVGYTGDIGYAVAVVVWVTPPIGVTVGDTEDTGTSDGDTGYGITGTDGTDDTGNTKICRRIKRVVNHH